MSIYVVIGPPAAGKSTEVRNRARPGDVTIDFDALAGVLAVPDPDRAGHDHPPTVQAVAKAARNAAIDAATRATGCDVWIIHSTPSPARLDEYRRMGAEIIVVDPGKATVMARCARERPRRMLGVAHQWYEDAEQRAAQLSAPPAPAPPAPTGWKNTTRTAHRGGKPRAGGSGKRKRTTTQRGLGHVHQQRRASLMRKHVDGTPCWWCGRPMVKAVHALAADHTVARAHGGNRADRLLHDLCNKQRGDGSRDHLRPAVTGEPGPVLEQSGTERTGDRGRWTTSAW